MGLLTLATEQTFKGNWHGSEQEVQGEIVFYTGMAGYEEVITDPSYQGQTVVFSYPLIGQYGIQHTVAQSDSIQAAGIIVDNLYEGPIDHGRITLADFAAAQGVPILSGVDTRSLIQSIREQGTMESHLSADDTAAITWHGVQDDFFQSSAPTESFVTFGQGAPHIGLVDFHYKSSILDELLKRDCRVTIIPFDTTTESIEELALDGLLFSNGPGNPQALAAHFPVYRQWAEQYPSFGICLGHQVLACAFGAATEKLAYGHRGANHPVRNLKTGHVSMSSQNHSYVVIPDSIHNTDFTLLYENVNDGSIEGLLHKTLPVMTVQFHPEAAPGPIEHLALFDQFLSLLTKEKKVHIHA